jgi:hypothetical protein
MEITTTENTQPHDAVTQHLQYYSHKLNDVNKFYQDMS